MHASDGAAAIDELKPSAPALPPTLDDLMRAAFTAHPNAPALVAADGGFMSGSALLAQSALVKATLRQAGIAPDDRVAVVLPNGPTLAALFISIASCAGCAPINPACSTDECDFYLRDMKAKALVTIRGTSLAAEAAAQALGIAIISCRENAGAGTGHFSLDADTPIGSAAEGEAEAETCALMLYTSGTTSKPKLVPLRHRNLVASAMNMVATLELTAADRCLNLMPLFHIHGLVGGLLAPLAGGGAAICPPSLRPGDFFRWMKATQPTWTTAVPTMLRAIVNEAAGHEDQIARTPLRFVRSSSAPLPAQLFDELERVFRAPVLEAYSMTENAHQMTCNPLGSGRQRRGTVGRPAGPQVGVMDDDGRLLPQGETGEVVIRGPSVMSGYEANPQANATSFTDGWFRTGDQGRFDEDGYLTLTGRLKEQINRGGEKFAPLEIDQVLLAHSDVAEAATFGFPHATLGEEVAAAVVLRPGASTDAEALRAHMRERLAPFKIPRRILMLDAIPKGPTGKVQRGQLHKQLGLSAPVAGAGAPASASKGGGRLHNDLLRLWRNQLGSEAVGPDDDFFESGGDSLMAVTTVVEIERLVGRPVPESILIEYPTVAGLAEVLADASVEEARPLIHLQTGDGRPPLFFFHGDHDGGYYTRRLARLLGPDQPFITIAPHGLGPESIPDSIEAMAWDRLRLLLLAQPEGSFRLAGYCNAGMVVLEVARLLREAGRKVDVAFLVDVPMVNLLPMVRGFFHGISRGLETISPDWERRAPQLAITLDNVWRQTSNFRAYRRDPHLLRMAVSKLARLTGLRSKAVGQRPGDRPAEVWERERRIARVYNRLFRHYVPSKTDLDLIYFEAEHNGRPVRRLGPNIEVIKLPGGHWGCITTHAEVLAGHMRAKLDALDGLDIRSAQAESAATPRSQPPMPAPTHGAGADTRH